MALTVGMKTPGFTLKATDNQDIPLSRSRGKRNVLLVFYCRNDTPVETDSSRPYGTIGPSLTDWIRQY